MDSVQSSILQVHHSDKFLCLMMIWCVQGCSRRKSLFPMGTYHLVNQVCLFCHRLLHHWLCECVDKWLAQSMVWECQLNSSKRNRLWFWLFYSYSAYCDTNVRNRSIEKLFWHHITLLLQIWSEQVIIFIKEPVNICSLCCCLQFYIKLYLINKGWIIILLHLFMVELPFVNISLYINLQQIIDSCVCVS